MCRAATVDWATQCSIKRATAAAQIYSKIYSHGQAFDLMAAIIPDLPRIVRFVGDAVTDTVAIDDTALYTDVGFEPRDQLAFLVPCFPHLLPTRRHLFDRLDVLMG